MNKSSLVSVIVTTRNNHETLGACLLSIKKQSYESLELIVVDNNSTDDTRLIAKRYTEHIYVKGPERSTQRNFGVEKTKGSYVLIIDSDMELGQDVVKACVEKVQNSPSTKAVIIPEESFGVGFWAQCKRLERSFYVGVRWIEAARFFDKSTYEEVGGYDESLVSGEDWDLSRRVEMAGNISNVTEFIRHNEGHINLLKTLKKKYYYAQHAKDYLVHNPEHSMLSAQVGPIQRYKLFLSHPVKLFKNPFLGTAMLFMKSSEFAVGAAGFIKSIRSEGVPE
jgi:glycosyltransferase involved in cell wall biosynthesis